MIHGRGGCHRRRQERLDLIGAEPVPLEPQRELEHVFVGGARVRGDEVGDQVLLLASLLAVALEQLLEALVGADPGLHHLGQRPRGDVLGGELEVAAHVMGDQLAHVLGRLDGEVVAQARSDQDLLDAGQRAGLTVEIDQIAVVGVQVVADARVHARGPPARGLDLGIFAAKPPHVGRGAANVGDDAREPGDRVADLLDLADHRRPRAALNDPTLVLGDRAKRAAAKAAAHDHDRGLDHLVGGDLGVFVARVRAPAVGQLEHLVHLGGRQGDRRWVDPHVAVAVALDQDPTVVGVGLLVEHARGVGVEHLVVADGLERGQSHGRALARRGHGSGARVDLAPQADQALRLIHIARVDLDKLSRQLADDRRGAADIAKIADELTLTEAMGDLDDRALGVAVDQKIGLGVEQHAAPDLVGPIVVVGDAAQAGLDPTDDHGDLGRGFTAALRVDDDRAIGARARAAAGRVGVVRAVLAIRGVVVDQRVHVAAGHPPKQVGRAELRERFGVLPVGLREHAHAEALVLEHPADHGRAKADVIDVRVTGHDDDVAAIPAELVHLGAGRGKERGDAEAMRPVLSPTEQRRRARTGHGHGRRVREFVGPHRRTPSASLFRRVPGTRRARESQATCAAGHAARDGTHVGGGGGVGHRGFVYGCGRGHGSRGVSIARLGAALVDRAHPTRRTDPGQRHADRSAAQPRVGRPARRQRAADPGQR
ncbi:hypothetical protein DB30_06711 [Enhygromyxa salina]|uniref:Uncharacterized protein n=1 Tax=Enhygromyxa salina TaxID=215803 RepID=A0A0C1ZA46_9BACT|nr:hypothetical protein DB30_06711 [Enhygromyxa salina]